MLKAMILAAGQGKRLRPITNTIPKPMVSAGGKSLIEWHLHKLKALGIDNIVVNGAYLKEVCKMARALACILSTRVKKARA